MLDKNNQASRYSALLRSSQGEEEHGTRPGLFSFGAGENNPGGSGRLSAPLDNPSGVDLNNEIFSEPERSAQHVLSGQSRHSEDTYW